MAGGVSRSATRRNNGRLSSRLLEPPVGLKQAFFPCLIPGSVGRKRIGLRLATCALRRCFRTNARTNADSRNRRAADFSRRRKRTSKRFLPLSPHLPGLKSGARQTSIAEAESACGLRRAACARSFRSVEKQSYSCSYSYSATRTRQPQIGNRQTASRERQHPEAAPAAATESFRSGQEENADSWKQRAGSFSSRRRNHRRAFLLASPG